MISASAIDDGIGVSMNPGEAVAVNMTLGSTEFPSGFPRASETVTPLVMGEGTTSGVGDGTGAGVGGLTGTGGGVGGDGGDGGAGGLTGGLTTTGGLTGVGAGSTITIGFGGVGTTFGNTCGPARIAAIIDTSRVNHDGGATSGFGVGAGGVIGPVDTASTFTTKGSTELDSDNRANLWPSIIRLAADSVGPVHPPGPLPPSGPAAIKNRGKDRSAAARE